MGVESYLFGQTMNNEKEAAIEEQILELGRLVALLRDRDRELRVFGADKRGGHQYLFRPPLSEMQLAGFEAEHQIALPAEYRLFLALVGNGGAGPYYGLMSLDETARNHDLRAAFPWTSEITFQSRGDARLALWLKCPGILKLSHQGCGNYVFLVVRGTAYGQLWIEAEARLIPKSVSFIKWYRAWAISKLRCLEREPLLDHIRIGMSVEEVKGILGDDMQQWAGSKPDPGKYYIGFRDTNASFTIDGNGRVTKINRVDFL